MAECGVRMTSMAQLGHVHVCSRPKEHNNDPKDLDHYCRSCNRHFWGKHDARRKP